MTFFQSSTACHRQHPLMALWIGSVGRQAALLSEKHGDREPLMSSKKGSVREANVRFKVSRIPVLEDFPDALIW